MEITVWTKSFCVQCEQTKKRFDKLGIRYTEANLEENPDKVEEFKAQGLMAAPIVVTDTTAWSGFRIEKIDGVARHIKSNAPKD